MNVRFVLSLLTAVLLLLPLTLAGEADPSTYTSVGEALPEIDFATVDGTRVTNETLKGKIVVLNFFATWCGPCRTELPHLEEEVWQAFRGEGFEMVVVGREHSAAEMNTFRAETGFTFPLAADPLRATYGLFAEKWIPRTYVVDRDGTIMYQSKGYDAPEFAKMVTMIEEALEPRARQAVERDDALTSNTTIKAGAVKSVTVSGETRIRVQRRD